MLQTPKTISKTISNTLLLIHQIALSELETRAIIVGHEVFSFLFAIKMVDVFQFLKFQGYIFRKQRRVSVKRADGGQMPT